MLRLTSRRIRSFAVLAAVAVSSSGLPVFCQEPAMTGGSAPRDGLALSATESAVIAKTNAARARSGLAPLSADGQLMNGARNHARWMARNRNLSHGQGVTENIAMGQTSATEAISSWMQSSGHRANMLGHGHTRIGVAMVQSADGTAYWCQQFR